MAIERISSPPFLDETAQSILLALQGIRSAVQPANVYLDLDITLAVSGWSSAAPYTYDWTSDKINDSCSVKVSFLDGAEDTNPLYLEYEKTAGGIQFVAPVKPTAAIPVRVHIIYADANAITDVDDEMVSSSAISGAVNVKEALQNVDNRLDNVNTSINERFLKENVIADLNDAKVGGCYRTNLNTQNRPFNGWFTVFVMQLTYTKDISQIAFEINTNRIFTRAFHDGTTWTAWQELVSKSDIAPLTRCVFNERNVNARSLTFTTGLISNWQVGILIANINNVGNAVYIITFSGTSNGTVTALNGASPSTITASYAIGKVVIEIASGTNAAFNSATYLAI